MSLREFCERRVITISPRNNITDACRLMAWHSVGCMIVQENGELCGILTDRDIALKVAGASRDARQTKVGQVMTPDPVCISVDSNLHELTRLMHAHHVRRVPIINGGKTVVGIVTLDDLIGMFSNDMFEIGRTVSESVPTATA